MPIPASAPETVSQFGIRRQRASQTPAHRATTIAGTHGPRVPSSLQGRNRKTSNAVWEAAEHISICTLWLPAATLKRIQGRATAETGRAPISTTGYLMPERLSFRPMVCLFVAATVTAKK